MRDQRGAALVVAIFLLVVLALLGGVAARLTATQGHSVSLGLQSARAYQAARTGLEWGAYRALNSGTCVSGTLNLTEAATNGFSVDVNCVSSSHAEGGATVQVFELSAFATSGTYGGPEYVSRRVTMVVGQSL